MTLAAAGRVCNGTLDGPSRSDALADDGVPHPQPSRPFCQCQGLPEGAESAVTSRVSALRAVARPADVARLVVAVTVDAVKRLARWARPHVSRERGEVVMPCRMHGDPASPIALVGDVARLITALLGCGPRAIFTRTAFTVRRVLFGHAFTVDAAATRRVARGQLVSINHGDVAPAIAATVPRRSAATIRTSSYHHQPSEPLSRQVDMCRHGLIIGELLHLV
jgi:hypothetical protein